VSRRLAGALLCFYVPLRLYLATLPGYVPDMAQYKRWATGVAAGGLGSAYETTGVDYPPLFLYVLWPIGKLYALVGPRDAAGALEDSTLWTALVKMPHLVFDLLLAGLLAAWVGRAGLWGPTRAGPGWGRLAALLYLWNPAVLWGSAYWGQPDGVHSALALAALACLTAGRLFGAGVLLAAAGMMKPLAAPLLPLLVAAAAFRGGARGVILVALGGFGAALLVLSPFIATGRGPAVLHRLLADLNAMPFRSINAHNLWWLVGPWRSALGMPQAVGLGLFAAVDALLLWHARRWLAAAGGSPAARGVGIILLAAAAVACFFLFVTGMHENHLFLAIPLLVAVAGRRPGLAWMACGCSLAVLLNMLLHDLHVLNDLPGFLGWPSPMRGPARRPYTWLQLVGGYFDTALVATLAIATCVAAWRETRVASPPTMDERPTRT
jgi:hypothetical protein